MRNLACDMDRYCNIEDASRIKRRFSVKKYKNKSFFSSLSLDKTNKIDYVISNNESHSAVLGRQQTIVSQK